ncbi:PorP/SprF family type IX secretion system membrane protein [Fulvivirga sediminis]|uniref:PorP/SprF family type IX secretion system membrane protein n=1 Tax=Fulvivirga sediminis TaxID=2803949 RepID=A0A937FDK0_9BACT|nr:PorP/SprF family type IX secretion system membrane protein [Fulvivirga sediminis]MBL3658573.1 PorP/SprF family type IX secretion system membrane protein [Fulvivirga sediminis]
MREIYLISFIVLASLKLHGQGLIFSQYEQSILETNPARIALYPELRVTAQYRETSLTEGEKANQSLLTATYPLFSSDDRLRSGIGLSLTRQQTGTDMKYITNAVQGGYAYNVYLNRSSILSFGINVGWFQQYFSSGAIYTGAQWDRFDGFDSSLPTGEPDSFEKRNFLNLGAGLNYYKTDDEGKEVGYLGVATNYLNNPDISWGQEAYKRERSYSAQAYWRLFSNNGISIGPGGYYLYDNAVHFTQARLQVKKYFENTNPFDLIKDGYLEFYGGYRTQGRIGAGILIQQPSFRLGISYDTPSTGNTRVAGSAFEVSFAFRNVFQRNAKDHVDKLESTNDYHIGEVKNIDFGRDKKSDSSGNDSGYRPEKGDYNIALRQDFKFGFNESELNTDAKKYLDELVSLLKAHPNTYLEVIGHTDDIGSEDANEKIALQRASVVIDYLISKGIAQERLKATSKGDKDPLVPNTSDENRAKNRRVEFVIYE